jgi:hypothetical protein
MITRPGSSTSELLVSCVLGGGRERAATSCDEGGTWLDANAREEGLLAVAAELGQLECITQPAASSSPPLSLLPPPALVFSACASPMWSSVARRCACDGARC